MVGSLRPHRQTTSSTEERAQSIYRDGGGYDRNLMLRPESFCRYGRDQSFPKGSNRRGTRRGAKGTHQIVYYNTSRGKCYGVVTFWNPWSAVKATNDQNGRIVYYNTSRGKCYGFVTFWNPCSAVKATNDKNGRYGS